jgi:hypothetical protein
MQINIIFLKSKDVGGVSLYIFEAGLGPQTVQI